MSERNALRDQYKVENPTHYAKKIASNDIYVPKDLRSKYQTIPTNDGVSLKRINDNREKK